MNMRMDPADIAGNSGVDPGPVGLAATLTPANNAFEVRTVLVLDDQTSAAVTNTRIGAFGACADHLGCDRTRVVFVAEFPIDHRNCNTQ